MQIKFLTGFRKYDSNEHEENEDGLFVCERRMFTKKKRIVTEGHGKCHD